MLTSTSTHRIGINCLQKFQQPSVPGLVGAKGVLLQGTKNELITAFTLQLHYNVWNRAYRAEFNITDANMKSQIWYSLEWTTILYSQTRCNRCLTDNFRFDVTDERWLTCKAKSVASSSCPRIPWSKTDSRRSRCSPHNRRVYWKSEAFS